MRDTQIRKEGKSLYSGGKTETYITTQQKPNQQEIQNMEANSRAKYFVSLVSYLY